MMGLPTMRCEGFTKKHRKGTKVTKELIHIFQMNVTNKLRNNDDLFGLSSDLFKTWKEFGIYFFQVNSSIFRLEESNGSRNSRGIKSLSSKWVSKKELDITTCGLLKYTYMGVS